MHDRFRMDDYANLVWLETKEPVCFDYLESFVHQGRGVDRDLRSHVPCRMTKRFGDARFLHLCFVLCPKRPARGCQYYSSDFRALFSAQALMKGVVLRVNRQKLRARRSSSARHQLAGYHQCLFVRKSHSLPRFECAQGWYKSDRTHSGGDDAIGLWMCGYLHQTCFSDHYSRQINVSFKELRAQLMSGSFCFD